MCAIEYYTYEDYKSWKGDWKISEDIILGPNLSLI